MDVIDLAKKPQRVAFAARLARLREAYGRRLGQKMPQIRFAELLGVTQAAYARWEKGDVFPNSDALEAIRNVTGCSLDSLIAGVQPGSPVLLGDLVPPPTHADRFRGMWDLKEAAEVGRVSAEDWASLLRELESPAPTLADRFRWVRQVKEPDEERAAEALGISVDGLLAIESGTMPPTVEKLTEFSVRMGVTTDFLTMGHLAGIQDQALLMTLLDQHPSLGREKSSFCLSKHKEPGGGSIALSRKAARAA